MIRKLIIKNELSELSRIFETLEGFVGEGLVPESEFFNLNLAIEELVTNTISYGFPQGGEYDIEIKFKFENNTIEIQIIDEGIEFNPLKKEAPDINLPVEEREIGGLGIFFVKNLVDVFDYERANGKNLVTLKKTFR